MTSHYQGSTTDELRRARGSLYLSRARLERYEHAWPEPRVEWQQKSIENARQTLAAWQQRVDELEAAVGS